MLFSILIPVRDDRESLLRCLTALKTQDLEDCEILVCDDGSEPHLDFQELSSVVSKLQFIRQERRGVAAARNRLAREASGEYLFFLDSDVLPLPETLALARSTVAKNPGIQAFFGSYDDDPDHSSVVSVYKNLFHHFVHQQSAGAVATFWCGCGVMRRDLYMGSGGICEGYRRPSVEDIELGMRLSRQGVVIRIFPQLQVKHLKRWTFWNWLYSDLFLRGVPWVRLMHSRKNWINQLNLRWEQRLSVLAGTGAVGMFVLTPLASVAAVGSALALAGFLYLNRDFFTLVARKRGAVAALAALLLHLLYSLVCTASFVIGLLLPARRHEESES